MLAKQWLIGIATWLGKNLFVWGLGIATLVEDYLRLASTVRAIIRACDITSPREYQWDIRNLPSLVQANLDTVEYLSEVNQGIIDSNMAVCDRLHALDPTYLTHTHA
ncbi:hypothetical protein ACG7TL_008851 [Trametes sanguinea]